MGTGSPDPAFNTETPIGRRVVCALCVWSVRSACELCVTSLALSMQTYALICGAACRKYCKGMDLEFVAHLSMLHTQCWHGTLLASWSWSSFSWGVLLPYF